MKLKLSIIALLFAASNAHALVITDRSTFESSIGLAYNEDFETLTGTNFYTGPITMPTGLVVSSPSNDLFSAGPGQSTNPTEGIGSNTPRSDYLAFDLGGTYEAFGADFFQNNGGGSQFTSVITYQLSFFDSGSLIDTITGSVAPNGGSFIGYISNVGAFDSVQVFSQANSYEVADNVTVGNATTVPEPATIGLMGLGMIGLGLMRRSKD